MGNLNFTKRARASKLNFTKRALEALPVPEKGARAERHQDTAVDGLSLKIEPEPSGTKTFFWRRKAHGQEVRLTIGEFPIVSLDAARARSSELNGARERWKSSGWAGPSPFERVPERQELTLDQLTDAYIEQHLKQHAKRPEKAEKDLRWMMARYLSSWRERKLSEITQEDVAALHRRCGADHGHRTANRVAKQIRTMYNFGAGAKLWRGGENPGRGIKFFYEPKRERFLQPEELPSFAQALREVPNQDFQDFVQIALFAGARKSDILSMRWADLSLAERRWTVPNPKSRRAYNVLLDPDLVEILLRRQAHPTASKEWVFPGVGKSEHIVDLKRRWKELLGKAKLSNLTQHDLRRSFGSYMAMGGAGLPIIGGALGHQPGSSATAVYARFHDPARRAAQEASNATIRSAMNQKPKALLPAAPKARKVAARG